MPLPPTRALHLTAAPLGSRTVQTICQRLLQPTGRFRRRSLSLHNRAFGDKQPNQARSK